VLWLLALSGCAWFREPPGSALDAPPSATAESRPLAGGLPPPEREPHLDVIPYQGGPADSVNADSTAVADTSASAVATPRAGAPADSGAAAEEAAPGSDLWEITGYPLVSSTGPQGQIIDITNPVITHGELIITSPTARYLVDEGRAEFEGEVAFSEGETRGRSTHATYLRDTETLIAEGDVEVDSPPDSLRLWSDRARYDRTGRVMTMLGDVRGRRGERRMSADEAEWRRERDDVLLTGDVHVTEDDGTSQLSGERLIYDLRTDRARVTEVPALVLTSGTGTTTRITGDRLWVAPGGDAEASGNVRILRGGVTAQSDSASYRRDEHRALLLGSPRVIERDGTLTGDTLILHFDADEALTRAEVHGHAAVRHAPIDSLRMGEVSTVRGDSLVMYFVDGMTERVVTFGNASSTYSPATSDAGKGAGTNAAQGDTITIFFDAGDIDRVRINGHAKGVYAFSDAGSDSAAAADSAAADPTAADSVGVPGEPRADAESGAAAPAPTDTLRAVSVGGEKVVYEADVVEYAMADRVVDLLGNTKLDYGAITLTAGKVRFFTDRRYLEAEDKPVLVEKEAGDQRDVVGASMDYNLDSREGTIGGGRTKAEDGFIYSERLRKIGDDEFLARGGSYTSCDNVEHDKAPHFHFTSHRMRIYLKDKVVAKPVTLYIRDIPVFALPFYVFSIRKGRQSGLLTPDFDFGLTGNNRRFFKNLGYYWAASEYYDLTLSANYIEGENFTGRVQTRYAKRYLMDGNVNFARTLGASSRGYDLTGFHQMTLGDWRMTGRAEFRSSNFRTSQPLSTDYGQLVDRILKSDLSASRSFGWGGSLSLTANRTQDLAVQEGDGRDETLLTETLPSYSFSLNSRTLGRKPDERGEGGRLPFLSSVRYSLSSRGSSTRTEREKTTVYTAPADTLYQILKDRSSSAQHNFNVSDSRRFWNAFNLQPSINLTENWVDREFSATDTVKAFRRAAVWSASLSTGTAMYGTFGGLGPLAALRHTFEPSASLTYSPEFSGLAYHDTTGTRRNRFPGVSSFERRRLDLRLRNGFQGKVNVGEEVRKVDLLNWSLSSGYDFLASDAGGKGWSPVNSVLDLPRILGVDLSFNSVHDPYQRFRFTSYQSTAVFGFSGVLPGGEEGGGGVSLGAPDERGTDRSRLGGDIGESALDQMGERSATAAALSWNAGFNASVNAYRDGDRMKTVTSLTSNASVQITKNWSVTHFVQWDATAGKVAAESLSLLRDLHCWEAAFTRSKFGDNTTFYFRINVKSLPDIKYQQGEAGAGGLGGFGGLTRALP
jgi:lipopolysaccharide assembly outer membrane protein LptD (OstA)